MCVARQIMRMGCNLLKKMMKMGDLHGVGEIESVEVKMVRNKYEAL